MQHLFLSIYIYFKANKFRAIGVFLSLFVLLFYFATRISFQENITQLIPSNSASDVTSKVLKQVNFADKITIIISSEKEGNSDDLCTYANQFIDSIDVSCKPYISKVQGKLDEKNIQETFGFVYENLPLFLDKNDYDAIKKKINNDSIAKIVETDYKSLIAPTGIVSKDFILKDPLGISFIALKKMQQLSVGDDFELQNGFVLTKDKKKLLLFLTPKMAANETDKNTFFIEKLNQIQNHLNSKYHTKVTMSYFGATPVAVANATQIKADVRNTSIFASVALMLVLIFFYRSVLIPIIIFIPSLFGAVFALTILYFTNGTISAISLGISSILLGETTDYSIYVLTHLRNKRDIKLLYKDISKPLLLCGTTTAISFLCLFFVKSEALKDLGIFAALSVILTSVFSLVLIPLLYRIAPNNVVETQVKPVKFNIIDKLGAYSYHKNKILVLSVVLLLIISFFTYSKVTFNNDLSALNFMPNKLQKAQKELENIANVSSKSIYLATYGKSYEEVLEKNNVLFNQLQKEKKASQILNFSSIGGMVLSKEMQQQKIQDWNAFWDIESKSKLKEHLISSGSSFGFKQNAFDQFYQMLDCRFLPVSFREYAKIKSFFIDEFVAQKDGFYTVSTLVKVSNDKRDAFVNQIKKQKTLVVIDRQQTNEIFLGSLKNSFEKLVDYSFIAIFLILLMAFRRVELVVVSIIPILISWIITTGMMGLFGLQFNIINIIVCTLIFGIGVDYSIFMTTALQKEHTYGKEELPIYKTSILLSVATTILGIGVLIFAHHPALKSIALIAVIGVFSALLMTYIIQPLVFQFFVTHRTSKGRPPLQSRTFIHGVLSFFYYGFGGFLMSIFSLTLLNIIPLKVKIKMKGFRYVISKFMKSVLYTNPFVKKKIINLTNEKFEKPAVIIANHTSVLDILAVGMLSSKTIYLVSDWVYNSPIFGGAVRKAGFYPVSEGLEGGVEHLRKKIEEGYSVIVFPEGTRSLDNQIKRFHKGAFFLAEYFNLDILPVLIHGNSEVLPKGDFVIYDGAITIAILDRIKSSDIRFGTNYTDRTKNISTYFKSEFKKMRIDCEDSAYFKKILLNSFDYKESFVINEVKRNLQKYLEVYYDLNFQIASKAKILHISDDYGQWDVYLTLQESSRKIDSYIENSNKKAVARTNYHTKTRSINYIDKLDFSKKYDLVLISTESCITKIKSLELFSDTIILIHNNDMKNNIMELGFEISSQNNQLIVFNKK
ncbi:1-acyl-sn-glycerol-3-phosphate acyltransferase [Flavobacterium aciduliphilum]|uniref:1-acyl-sn-glycerol-3-phosphate acyltransferase n=1 Tax=Flavobacterium aciduliphilum TaxID=1101402 RepID=A0A328YBY4_9FLAO|nr:1-acyl-sn-glycerol-3-phosphate acyltransferase [Flavobacterium aciduliphilum]RAR71541.1 1-acyl-sn-glycerol-3-phosphate acyltransferase [Flavobacterium aciduliphilum]